MKVTATYKGLDLGNSRDVTLATGGAVLFRDAPTVSGDGEKFMPDLIPNPNQFNFPNPLHPTPLKP